MRTTNNYLLLQEKFFEQSKNQVFTLANHLTQQIQDDKSLQLEFLQKRIDPLEFSKQLFIQILFLYFLQKKGWLGISTAKGKGDFYFLQRVFQQKKATENFFEVYLKYLLYETLNSPEKKDHPYFDQWNFPYLHEELFLPPFQYCWKELSLTIPDTFFSQKKTSRNLGGLFEIFESYSFHLKEEKSTEKISPEMLGSLFEQLRDLRERKAKGSFYTPPDFVDYMCLESLFHYLKSCFEERGSLFILTTDLRDFLRSDSLSKTIKENALFIDEKLAQIRCCDLSLGAGAFLIGLVQSIVDLRDKLTPYINTKKPRKRIALKRAVLQNNLFGIEIDVRGIEVCKFRLWLSVISDEEDFEEIQPLPNLEYRLVQGNALVDFKRQISKKNIKEKQLKQLAQTRNDFYLVSDPLVKREIKQEVEMLSEQLVPKRLQGDVQFCFSEVFQEKEGFDLIIGNPPYLKERDNATLFKAVNETSFGQEYHQGKMDYWFYFLHKAIDSIHQKGIICYITSRYWLNSAGAQKLISRIQKELYFLGILDIGKMRIFPKVTGHHMIASYAKKKQNDIFPYQKIENNLADLYQTKNTANFTIYPLKNSKIFTVFGEILLADTSQTLKNIIPLGMICDISQGVVEATNKISKKQQEESEREDIKTGQGVFVLTKDELDALKLNAEEQEICVPYLEAAEIGKFYLKPKESKFLIYSDKENKKKIEKQPAFQNLKQHLIKFQGFITSSNKPYGIHRARQKCFFTAPKIIFKNMFVTNEFAYDEKQYFLGFSLSTLIQKDQDYSLKYILALLNSSYALNWFYENGKKRGAGVDIGVGKLRTFPIKKLSQTKQQEYINLVEQIMKLKKDSLDADTFSLEKELDEKVAQLYRF